MAGKQPLALIENIKAGKMNQFSAKEPSLGYHYQIRYALYLLLKARDKDNPFVKIENLDDVEIGDLNKVDLHQTKFHNQKSANLTDASSDIWKTIRVWSEMASSSQIDIDDVLLVLLTTSSTSVNSILFELTENRIGNKSAKQIVEKLNEVTKTSKSGTKSKDSGLKPSFDAYNKLSEEQKEKLVKSIHIRDNALDFDSLKKEIQKELQFTCLPEQIESVFDGLQGWWYEQCIQHLGGNNNAIYLEETRKYIIYLNDKFKSDNLPIDGIIKQAEIDEAAYDNRIFVSQLLEIGVGYNTLKQAKRDLYRAGEQRSKWLRDYLLHPQEEIDYEFNLRDDWSRKFALLQDDITGKEEAIQKELCKLFYTNYYIQNYPPIFIRSRVTDSFLVTGSCHMLADKQDIAWHPKYLKAL